MTTSGFKKIVLCNKNNYGHSNRNTIVMFGFVNKKRCLYKENFIMPQYKKLTNESKLKFKQIIEDALIEDRILVKIDDSGKRELYYNLPLMVELKTL